VRIPIPIDRNSTTFRIYVKTLTGKTIKVDLKTGGETIEMIKLLIRDVVGISPDQ
jgi:hypothetical protein